MKKIEGTLSKHSRTLSKTESAPTKQDWKANTDLAKRIINTANTFSAAGLTLRKISSHVGCSHETVRLVLREHGILLERGITKHYTMSCAVCGKEAVLKFSSGGKFRRKTCSDACLRKIGSLKSRICDQNEILKLLLPDSKGKKRTIREVALEMNVHYITILREKKRLKLAGLL